MAQYLHHLFTGVVKTIIKILQMTSENKKEKEKDPLSTEEIKKEPGKDEPLHKGYNEKNPSQPQGAFKPDSKSDGQLEKE